jgi:acyl-coenzyme A thioesterase PaaI-like protein
MQSLDASLQERFAPHNACFGCGPSNPKGLRVRSFPVSDRADAELTADWSGEKHHEAFDGVLNGGVISALLDCHSNWTAAWHLMKRDGLDRPPCTVTAELLVQLRAPTPSDRPLHLSARPVGAEGDWVTVEARLESAGKVTATCTGKFVAVKPGHPAYHRW